MSAGRKVTVLGGGGARMPLLIHGLAEANATLGVTDLALYDADPGRAEIMAALGREIVRGLGAEIRIHVPLDAESAIEGAAFVLSSFRQGGIEARARDERIIIEHGYVGQETTGPGGLAMALRTIPVALEHARLVERLAPDAWLINFTNPAGLITQALTQHSRARVVGICDTPSELFQRIAWALAEPVEEMEFRYAGLNHLGWVENVLVRGANVTARLLSDDQTLLRLYPARLFEPEMIRALGLIPTEYLFFYYGRSRALRNQRQAGASRGEELVMLNRQLFEALAGEVARGDPQAAIRIYKDYLNARNASYLRLEAHAESALAQGAHEWDPFQGATGYHRIAIDVMAGLAAEPRTVVVNIRNGDAIDDLEADDVVEVPARIGHDGPVPVPVGPLPETVSGLVLAVKAYERLAIRAAVERSMDQARLALLMLPIVGEWDRGAELLEALVASDPVNLGYLRG